MAAQPASAEILAVIRPAAERAGLDVEGVEVVGAGRRPILRILVDKDGGVGLDDIAVLTTRVGQELDASDVMGDHAYTLEVTSPGVNRPLTEARHWRRNVGRLLKVTCADGSVLSGRLTDAGDSEVVVDVDGATRRIPYREVAQARVEIEFNRRGKGKD
jgi:ribosome maturation factor RimP